MDFVCPYRPMLALTVLLLVGCRPARAQAAAERAATSSVSGGVSAQTVTMVSPQRTTSTAQNSFAHLVAPSGLPPAKYQVQMSGQRLESAKQIVALLPRETQEVELTLAIRYPLRVTVH